MSDNGLKLDRAEMEEFSEQLNLVFGILNELTGTKVFSSCVIFRKENGKQQHYLSINICGRDSLWTDGLEVVDQGMYLPNPIIDKLKEG